MNSKQDNKAETNTPKTRLRLFVAGEEANSLKARLQVLKLMEGLPADKYTLEIIDVLKDYNQAIENNILAIPTLIIISPSSCKTIIGSLSDKKKLKELVGILNGREQ